MPYTREHGGLCCGIKHKHDFYRNSTKRDLEPVKRGLTEIVLTDGQIVLLNDRAYTYLKSKYRLVTRFFNSNSGNYCNIFHFCVTKKRNFNERNTPQRVRDLLGED